MIYASDQLASDDLDAVVELSRKEHRMTLSNSNPEGQPSYLSRKQHLKEKLAQCDAEISKYEDEIRSLQDLVNHRKGERDQLLKELETTRITSNGASNERRKSGIDYAHQRYEWTTSLKAKMKSVFNIDNFRLCQEGVCNANMDERDIVCVMPTGGGKSLTYQLPALLQSGCTIVISPLISLITDQILHLQESGVQAVKITGTTSKQEVFDITRRLTALAGRSVESRDKEIKLCYVTPEKIAKSKTFVSLLQKLADASQLARFVIDEAHCVSQLGHDFRPDYSKLHILRKLFPRVPIMALSATCPPRVLDSLISILGLEKVVDGNNAAPRGTVYFTAPLYRKNLHYSIVPKPARGAEVLQAMTDYILQYHPEHSGIIYCLSKKDAENVAKALRDLSGNKIKTGVYHSDRHDGDKENLHVDWRRGTIKVVCATIAFGLGIDKGDVRFVLHHSISKSLEGFYQESGRAGRDGKDSDCILYYRPQDGTTLSSMVAGEKEGEEKLHAMLRFAQNMEECRKTQFAKYFSHTTQVAISAWSTAESDALSRCGHCDNCARPAGEIMRKNVTLQAWQLVKITDALNREGANVTLNLLAALARGNAKGEYEVSRGRGGKGKAKEKQTLDLEAVAGGEVNLKKDEIEHLLVDLLLMKYLGERYSQTAYTTNAYINCGPLAPSLTRHTQESLKIDHNLSIECVFRSKAKKVKANDNASQSRKPSSSKAAGKRKRVVSDSDDDDMENIDITLDGADDEDEDEDEASYKVAPVNARTVRPQQASPEQRQFVLEDTSEDDDDDDVWSHSFRKKGLPPSKKPKKSTASTSERRPLGRVIKEVDVEVIELSD